MSEASARRTPSTPFARAERIQLIAAALSGLLAGKMPITDARFRVDESLIDCALQYADAVLKRLAAGE